MASAETEPPPGPGSAAPERVTAALALLDAVEALYQSGYTLQLLDYDGKRARLRTLTNTAARVVPIVKV